MTSEGRYTNMAGVQQYAKPDKSLDEVHALIGKIIKKDQSKEQTSQIYSHWAATYDEVSVYNCTWNHHAISNYKADIISIS